MKKFFIPFILLFVIISCSDKPEEYNCDPTCKENEICTKENKCVAKNSCDPTCKENEICNNQNQCVAKGCNPTCKENEICNNQNQCVTKGCDNCKDWEECSEKVCKPKDGKCNIKADCNNDEACKDNSCIKIFCVENKCSNQEICIEEDKKCITNTGKCNDTTNKCEEGFTCNNDGYCENEQKVVFTTIRELQTNESFLNKKVMTKGVVSAIALSQSRNQKGLYIQDGRNKHSGMYIYFIAAGQTNIKVGDQVKITGILDRESTYARIRTDVAEINVLSSNETVFEKIEVNYFADDITDYESMLVKVKLESRFNMKIFLDRHLVFMNDQKDKILVKDTISWLNHISLNVKLVKLVGIIDNSKDGVRILPRSESDIEISTPSCNPACKEWKSCLEQNVCILDTARCENSTECEVNYSCNTTTHYCEVSETILNNGEFEEWTGAEPTGYFYGSALRVYKENSKKYQTNYAAKVMRYENLKEGTSNVNILSPKIAVDYTKNYKLSLFVLDNDYDVDCRIYYEAYDADDTKIGSGIPPSNDGLTKNVDNWIELTFTTNFINGGQIWRGPVENLSYIRFGIRMNKGHDGLINGEPLDDTLPVNYTPSGTGKIYLDSLTIQEAN